MSDQTARQAEESDWLDWMAAAGLVAFGVVHVVIGWLAIQLAFGDREGGTSSTGAVRKLAQQPFGEILVWLIVIGMALLVIWRGTDAVLGYRDEDHPKRAFKKAVAAGKAIVYASIAYSAVKVVTGSSSSKGGGTDSMTAKVMDQPGGQVMVAAVGLGIIGVGIGLLVAAWRESYLSKMDRKGQSGHDGRTYRVLGRVGHVAKGVAFGGVGSLFLFAAITHEADKSGGLDQALRTVLSESYGPPLVIVIGLGFAAYGLFCFAQARHLDR